MSLLKRCKLHRLSIAVLLSTAILLLAGCRQDAPERLTVRIAHFPTITHAQAIVAREKGWFEAAMGETIDVSYTLFNAGSSEVEAFFSEQVDIGYIGPIPAVNGHIKSRGDLIIVSGVSNNGARLVGANASGIHTLSDLNGKSVSVPQIGNTQHIALLHLLSANDMADISHGGEVDLVVSSNVSVSEKMKSGDLDAAFLPEPWATMIVEAGIGYFIEDERLESSESSENISTPSNTAVVIVHKDFLAEHPDLVEAFLGVHVEATQYLLDPNSAEECSSVIGAFIKRETGQELSNQIVKKSLERLEFSVDPIVSSIMSYMQIFYDEGFITELASRNALIDLDLLNEVLKSVGLPRVEVIDEN